MIAHLAVKVDAGGIAGLRYGLAEGGGAGGDGFAVQAVGAAFFGGDGFPVVKNRQLQGSAGQHLQHEDGLLPGFLRGDGLGEEVHAPAQPGCPGGAVVFLEKAVLFQVAAGVSAIAAADYGEINAAVGHLLPADLLLPFGHVHPLAGGVPAAGIEHGIALADEVTAIRGVGGQGRVRYDVDGTNPVIDRDGTVLAQIRPHQLEGGQGRQKHQENGPQAPKPLLLFACRHISTPPDFSILPYGASPHKRIRVTFLSPLDP